MKIVSVVLPLYRCEKYVNGALDSILSQDLPDGWALEVLCAVDGCAETLGVLNARPPDPRVHVYVSDENVGPYLLWNTLIEKYAKGDVVVPFCGDDVMLTGALLACLGKMQDGTELVRYKAKFMETGKPLVWQNGHAEMAFAIKREAWARLNGFWPWRHVADSEFRTRADHLGVRTKRADFIGMSYRWNGENDSATASAANERKRVGAHGEASQLSNPPEIKTCTLRTVDEKWTAPDKLIVSVASIPSREKHLEQVCRAIKAQLPTNGRLCVYLNGYFVQPAFLEEMGVEVRTSQEFGDHGDASKFAWADEPGYHVTVDDDIEYPLGFLKKFVGSVEDRNRRVCACFAGMTMKSESQIRAREWTGIFDWTPLLGKDVPIPVWVHAPGTAAFCWHSSCLRLSLAKFPVPNMADLWVGVAMQRQQVPCVVLPHRGTEFRIIPGSNDTGIWESCKQNDGTSYDTQPIQIEAILARQPWILYCLDENGLLRQTRNGPREKWLHEREIVKRPANVALVPGAPLPMREPTQAHDRPSMHDLMRRALNARHEGHDEGVERGNAEIVQMGSK